MVARVQDLAMGYPEGRIELQLIGGFRDQQGYAEDLFYNLMRKYKIKTKGKKPFIKSFENFLIDYYLSSL